MTDENEIQQMEKKNEEKTPEKIVQEFETMSLVQQEKAVLHLAKLYQKNFRRKVKEAIRNSMTDKVL